MVLKLNTKVDAAEAGKSRIAFILEAIEKKIERVGVVL